MNITEKITIENLKCHGCANTIRRELSKLNGVSSVEIGMEESLVTVVYDDQLQQKDQILHKLGKIGYPEKGNNSFVSEVKSYVSCAIGRINS
jgi:copper chaperone CopZ